MLTNSLAQLLLFSSALCSGSVVQHAAQKSFLKSVTFRDDPNCPQNVTKDTCGDCDEGKVPKVMAGPDGCHSCQCVKKCPEDSCACPKGQEVSIITRPGRCPACACDGPPLSTTRDDANCPQNETKDTCGDCDKGKVPEVMAGPDGCHSCQCVKKCPKASCACPAGQEVSIIKRSGRCPACACDGPPPRKVDEAEKVVEGKPGKVVPVQEKPAATKPELQAPQINTPNCPAYACSCASGQCIVTFKVDGCGQCACKPPGEGEAADCKAIFCVKSKNGNWSKPFRNAETAFNSFDHKNSGDSSSVHTCASLDGFEKSKCDNCDLSKCTVGNC